MKIPKFDDKIYKVCSNCQSKKYEYTSKKCLHKLCENCYKTKIPLIDSEYICKICLNKKEENKHLRDDYLNKSPLEEFYDKDRIKRENLLKIVNKRKENFSSIEEYNDYLEFIEKCLRKNNLKEIDKKYNQDINEREKNEEKRKEKLNEIEKKIEENSPNHYNNTRIIIYADGNMEQEDIVKESDDPIRIMEDTIHYIKDQEKERKAGGYNIKNIYNFLSNFSKGGLLYQK